MLNSVGGPRGSPRQVYGSPMSVHECMWTSGRTLSFQGLPNTSVASRTKDRGSKQTPAATNGKGYMPPNTYPPASVYALHTPNQPSIPLPGREAHLQKRIFGFRPDFGRFQWILWIFWIFWISNPKSKLKDSPPAEWLQWILQPPKVTLLGFAAR